MATTTAAKITVHWLNNSRSQRILWLLEELELPYEIKTYERNSKTMLAPPELKAVHPLGKSPVVTIEEPSGTITLAESGAITEFLVERYGNGKLGIAATGDLKKRADYLYWLHFAEGTAMGPLIMAIVFAQMPKQAPFLARPLVSIIAGQVMSIYVRPKIKQHFAFINQSLEGKEFLVGDELTGADTMVSFPVEAIEASLGPDGWKEYPNIRRWWNAMQARPAFKKALERGGENDMRMFVDGKAERE